ncbi:hypothetical protein CCAND95_320005 [Capnocytophaga canis]|nr:hypothetical protein CCAND95_320005 [Capnocytophaga canis]
MIYQILTKQKSKKDEGIRKRIFGTGAEAQECTFQNCQDVYE